MKEPMPKLPQAYGKLQDIKGLASPQSSPVRCSPGGAGLCSAAACELALDIFPLQEQRGYVFHACLKLVTLPVSIGFGQFIRWIQVQAPRWTHVTL